ncbi:MAG TPA: tRNA (uridine(34)/cytosine(34)/5-carboxymethylaminomethyluridine(34)-2'-O)-methyltransferase TrmL [Burkholderiaceae bacterium]|nr:tRNA (uridine(34)/cytosine(34)/5-carboxymethylaminomethyluridine(34)-2'-O)-methyltransferase TrmL [Burkholderiaceae bacterium]
MFNVVLVEPEIPPNTGNVIRLCANTGVRLHLVRPLGFELSDKQLRRAGLDYHEYAALTVHDSFDALLAKEAPAPTRLFALTTRAQQTIAQATFKEGDWLVFGSETRGLSPALRESFAPQQRLRLPMRAHSRSLNLSNAVAVVVYEAWRQCGYAQGV